MGPLKKGVKPAEGQERHGDEYDDVDVEVAPVGEDTPLIAAVAPADGGRAAYLVLLGCCLLQFPVWGFVTSYGVLQEYYESVPDKFDGNVTRTGIIGTTLNGIMYLSMPVLFSAFAHRLIHYRKHAALLGIVLSTLSILASSFATEVWQLIMTQGVLQAFGSTILYSSTMIYLDEWFRRRKGFAFGVSLALKSAFGVASPLILQQLLARVGFEWALRIWALILIACAVPAIVFLLRSRHKHTADGPRHKRPAWSFLRHHTFWFFQLANIVFSTGYGLPQTYLSAFASNILGFSSAQAAFLLVGFNALSTPASFWFGLLSDGGGLLRGHSVSIATASLLSAMGACIPAFLFWGLVPGPGTAGTVLSILFACSYGFFAGGYSATWGGVVREMQREAEEANENIDTGLLFGLLNGGRGIGFVSGGFIGVKLLSVGPVISGTKWAYSSQYGSLILFTGISAALGGASVLCGKTKLRRTS